MMQKINRKIFLVAFLLKNSSCPIHSPVSYPIHPPIAIAKVGPSQIFPLFVFKIFKIAGRKSVMESLISKVTEASAFYYSADKSKT